MHILQMAPPWFTVPPKGYGGIEWIVSELTEGLVERGHDVTLLASRGSQTAARLVTVFDQAPSRLLGSAYHEIVHCVAGYRRRHEFDIVHDHSGIIGPSIGAFLDGPPVVHTLHGPWGAESKALYRALPPGLHLVAISHDQRSRAPSDVEIAGVVPNGTPVGRYPLREERRGTGGYLVFIGRASPEKGPDVAVNVARRLDRALKMVVKINEPEEDAYWRNMVQPLLGGADVEVLSEVRVDEKARLLAGADACLFPIQWAEPFGLVMTEAMACGTPVIAFANGAATEVVADGETGFLVEEGDIDGFCAAVNKVAEIDPRRCRAQVEEHYSVGRMVDGYERLYRDVLSSGPAGAAGDVAPR